MRSMSRIFAMAIAFAALGGLARAQSADRLHITVNTPVRIERQLLAPGEYEIAASAARGVFTIEEKSTPARGTMFLTASGVAGRGATYSGKGAVAVGRDANGEPVITEVCFPQSGLRYRFKSPEASNAGKLRAAIK